MNNNIYFDFYRDGITLESDTVIDYFFSTPDKGDGLLKYVNCVKNHFDVNNKSYGEDNCRVVQHVLDFLNRTNRLEDDNYLCTANSNYEDFRPVWLFSTAQIYETLLTYDFTAEIFIFKGVYYAFLDGELKETTENIEYLYNAITQADITCTKCKKQWYTDNNYYFYEGERGTGNSEINGDAFFNNGIDHEIACPNCGDVNTLDIWNTVTQNKDGGLDITRGIYNYEINA